MNELDHHTHGLLELLLKSFNRNIELKAELSDKINASYGAEKLAYIKKWNGMFVEKWLSKRG